MLFASYEFIGFLILTFLVYYLIPRRWQWGFLLLAGYIFYALADPRYLLFILFTSASIYGCGRWLAARKATFRERFAREKEGLDRERKKAWKAAEGKAQKRILLLGLLSNLGILAVTKYTNFAIVNVNAIRTAFGGSALSMVDLLVPMGISFYTFQSIGYLLDVYWDKISAEKNPLKFALFVSFFPQLVQGPISRFGDLSKTLCIPHAPSAEHIVPGLERILWGYFKKLVIADRMLVAVKAIIADPDTYGGAFAFAGMLFYALELYADFTGGIDITIGTAQVLGIEVAENFRRPYFSKGIKEYWKRWHITMGTWFTDYIFYPMSVSGGMQKLNKWGRKHLGDRIGKRLPVYLCSFAVWFTTGIWHGASWNFIVWGLGNFVVIMISQELEPLYDRFHKRFAVEGRTSWKIFQVVRTVLLMSLLRMFDCYRDVPLTFRMMGSMFTSFHIRDLALSSLTGLGLGVADYGILLAGTILLTLVSLAGRKGSVRARIMTFPVAAQCAVWFGLFLLVILFGYYGIGYESSQFIYNQF
ncbi:MAG: MBOAT family protein [Lachnospiraceae bacterium]|nr:MBOAT family protein [Lachnospiraceae bacterium]